MNRNHGLAIDGYDALYRWSIDHKEVFWSETWDFCGIVGDKGDRILVDGEDIERAQWFPDARLNFAENLLRRRDDQIAIYFRAEDQVAYELTWNQLHHQVASVAAWLRTQGLRRGDRVAAYLPNMPEAVVAMLAATSLGAVWTSTSPDFGVDSVVDRFGQTEPRFLFTADGYFYNGKRHGLAEKVEAIRAQLPSLEQVVQIPFAGHANEIGAIDWTDIVSQPADGIEFVACAFNDPLYVLYSSGTTGKPKCITHKIGGSLIQHLKEQMLHCDVKPGERVFYFTTLGWMMWNWLVSALASRAALVLYDGSPFYPDGEVLWRYAADIDMTLFSTMTVPSCGGPVPVPHIVFSGRSLTGGAILDTFAGGRIRPSPCAPLGTNCGFGPTLGDQIGLQPASTTLGIASSVNALAWANVCTFTSESATPQIPIGASATIDFQSPGLDL